HKMVKLKPFMDYIDMRLAENVWNSEVIFAEIKAMGYTCNFAFFSGLFDAQFWAGSAQPKSPELTANY
uniref:hypothetical protein n=1 Tax=Escherichia coli TaxID=562 RepID=UPI0020324A3F